MKTKKTLSILLAATLATSVVGCTDKEKKKAEEKEVKPLIDVRTEKIIGIEQAMLRFTTENKAGSLRSVELKKVDGKYQYIIEGFTKKGLEQTWIIDATNSGVISKTDKGQVPEEFKSSVLSFLPIMDIDKAGKLANQFSKKKLVEITSYKLYAEGNQNIYKFELGGTDDKGEKVTETVLINAITGKLVEPKKEDN